MVLLIGDRWPRASYVLSFYSGRGGASQLMPLLGVQEPRRDDVDALGTTRVRGEDASPPATRSRVSKRHSVHVPEA
jgi:hypothetical protein